MRRREPRRGPRILLPDTAAGHTPERLRPPAPALGHGPRPRHARGAPPGHPRPVARPHHRHLGAGGGPSRRPRRLPLLRRRRCRGLCPLLQLWGLLPSGGSPDRLSRCGWPEVWGSHMAPRLLVATETVRTRQGAGLVHVLLVQWVHMVRLASGLPAALLSPGGARVCGGGGRGGRPPPVKPPSGFSFLHALTQVPRLRTRPPPASRTSATVASSSPSLPSPTTPPTPCAPSLPPSPSRGWNSSWSW